MILEKLAQYYDTLVDNFPETVAPLGYSSARVSHAIVLSKDGHILDLIDLRNESNGKLVSPKMIVPLQETRSSGKSPYFLCDKSKYVFGFDGEACPDHFAEFAKLQHRILEEIDNAEAKAFVNFIDHWHPEKIHDTPFLSNQLEAIVSAPAFVFRLDGYRTFIHDNADIIRAWEAFSSKIVGNMWDLLSSKNSKSYTTQCLVTGEATSIARIHQSIKGVAGAQSSGAAIVSFNIESFLSYGKDQSYNAPIGRTAMLKYTTALNHLLASRNKTRIGDSTIVSWAERISPTEEALFKYFFDPVFKSGDSEDESQTNDSELKTELEVENNVKDILEKIHHGEKAKNILEHPDLQFYVLGLAPNASRISVRFWMVDNFGDLIDKITQHYTDMEIVKPPGAFDFTPPWALLKEIAVLGKTANIPNTMISSLNYSILSGAPYPYAMLSAIVGRIRADKEINYQRAGFIKAFLIRNGSAEEKKEVITVALNPDNKTPAYLLGRLFSLLEKVQIDAAGSTLNSTIKDRYFSSASATPAIVFPQLMRLSQHHINKADYGYVADRKIQEVINDLDGLTGLPKHLSLEDQGMFILGYYHQKQANFEKRQENTKE